MVEQIKLCSYIDFMLQQNARFLRIWIFFSIIETVVLLAITTAGSIYFTVALDVRYGLSIIALQILVSRKCPIVQGCVISYKCKSKYFY